MYMPFICKSCEISFPTQKKFDAHCATKKHISKSNEKFSFLCKCGKSYAYKTNLHRHWRNCPYTIENDSQNHHILSSQNGKITTVIGGTVVHNETYIRNEIKNEITENNIINPTFNFNFYLNEHCKDAVCIEDFCRIMIERFNHVIQDKHINMNFIDNQKTFEQMIGNLKLMESVQRPIQSYQGEIVEKSKDDWKALSLDKLNQHVSGITNKVNWDRYSNLAVQPQPTQNQEINLNMQALKEATQVRSQLSPKEMNILEKTTSVPDKIL